MFSSLIALIALSAGPSVSLERPFFSSVETPMRVELSSEGARSPLASADRLEYEIQSPDGGVVVHSMPVQHSKAFPDTLFFVLPASARPLEQPLSLSPRRLGFGEDDPSRSFAFEDDGEGRLTVVSPWGLPVMAYNYGTQLKEGVPANRARASYVHPIWGLDGEIVTDDFPEDHYHHRGLHWAWPNVAVNGEAFDLWHLRGIWQRFDNWLYRETGPVCALIGARNGWYLEGDVKVVDETIELVVWKPNGIGQAIDVKLTLQALDQPVTIQGTEDSGKGYGGMNLRFAPRADTRITTSEGPRSEDGLLFPALWSDMSARFPPESEGISGAALLVHPDHPRMADNAPEAANQKPFPPGWILRHYGFLGVSWPGLGTVTMEPQGEPIVLEYRIWVHRGSAGAGMTAEADNVYRNPPALKLD